MESKTMVIYNAVLNDIIYPVLGKKTTWSDDLTKMGKKLFGGNFVGSFPSDMIPEIGKNPNGTNIINSNVNKNSSLYCLLNLDDHTKGGSHWIAVGYDIPKTSSGGRIWVYDSFGRKTGKIIPSLMNKFGEKLRMADDDAEQKIEEDDCGARSLAFLYVMDRVGIQYAKLI